jgi:hypothetical protein
MELVLLVHLASTWAMVGLIWFVQLVHYPLFAHVGPQHFVEYEARHTRQTTHVVAVLMPVEAGTGLWLLVDPPLGTDVGLLLAGMALIAALWAATLIRQVPLHRALSVAHDPLAVARLVRSNWFRTVAWSSRGLLVLIIAGEFLGSRTP